MDTHLNLRPQDGDTPVLPEFLLHYRGVLIWIFHMVLAAASSYVAFAVRFDGTIPPEDLDLWRYTLGALLVSRGTMFVVFRLYEGLWRYTSVHDLLNILLSIGLSSLMFLVVIQEGLGVTMYPRSILLIDALLLTGFAGGARLVARAHRDLVAGRGGLRVLIYGAGDAGEALVREMRLSLASHYNPIGFIDDDRSKVGHRIHGIPVLGTRDDLPGIIKRHRPDEVLVTIPRADPETYRGVVRTLEPFEVPIKTLPHLREILDGKVSTEQIRDLSLEDLLRRTPIGLSRKPLLELVERKTILVTGAGGSIGSELCRQIAALKPAALILYERHENSLYTALKDLSQIEGCAGILHPAIGDISDRSRFKSVLEAYRPHIVFHAAAHKHVPLMEENICEAVKNNVMGTQIAVELAEECGVERFINISSDKAVNPVSVMGATKRVAELMLQARSSRSRTALITVRFGNVLGSNGSVVPLFVEQLKRGGPLTVTHPEMRRYFMLIPEAVQLVLHAASRGESNRIYVLDMGEPIRLVDIAKDLIRLSGFRPEEVPITFIGLRPGEKLNEELVGRDEDVWPSPVESVFQVQPRHAPDTAYLRPKIAELERRALAGDAAAVIEQLRTIVPEYESPVTPAPFSTTFAAVASTAPTSESTPRAEGELLDETMLAGRSLTCVSCHSPSVHRSRARGPLEQMRRQLTQKRPYRCYACGWRGWMDTVSRHANMPETPITPPDLGDLDFEFLTADASGPSALIPGVMPPLGTSPLPSPSSSLAGDSLM